MARAGAGVTRILALSLRYPPHYDGGYELSTESVLGALARRGHDVEVLVSDLRSPGVDDPPGERSANPSVRRELRPYLADNALHRPGPWTRWRMERHNHAVLREAIERFRPDVVGPWQMSALSLGLLTAVAEAGLPMVYMISDDWLSYGPELDAWSHLFVRRPWLGRALRPALGVPTVLPDLGATGRFLFISQLQWDRALRYGTWTYPDAEVVYAGFDTDRYPIAERPVDKPWEGRLLYAGRLDPRKGIECVIRALPLLPEAVLEVQGTGDRAYLRTLEELAAGAGVADRLDVVADRRGGLRERYEAADVVVFPSEWEEPFGLVPLEAMARGVPVVATGVGGSAEFLVDGENCLLHRPADHEGLAAAVSRLSLDPGLRHALALGGLRTVPRFTAERIADDFERHYGEVAERGRR